MNEPTPDVIAKVYLVPHGYQVDLVNLGRATADGQGAAQTTVCRDFGGTYDVSSAADAVVEAIVEAMARLERNHLKGKHEEHQD